MKINAQDTIYSTAAGALKIQQVKTLKTCYLCLTSYPLISYNSALCEALLTLHSISEGCAPVQTKSVLQQWHETYFCTALYFSVPKRESDSHEENQQEKAACMQTDDLCINLLQ